MNIISDNKEIIKIIEKEIKRILDFFNIKDDLKKDIHIKELNYNDFKKEFETYLNTKLDNYITGFIEDDKDTIVYLKYEDWNKTTHKDEPYEEYEKVIIHEFVHIIHSIYCNKNYPNDNIYEGVAYYLANQTNSNSYHFFKDLLNSKTSKEILEILKGNN